jgi:hypothetical protein
MAKRNKEHRDADAAYESAIDIHKALAEGMSAEQAFKQYIEGGKLTQKDISHNTNK